jgi:hypothetical protein
MSLLTRLYPESWRDRYAPEFDALLDEVPVTPSVVADVVAASVRARIRTSIDALREPSIPAIASFAGGATWALTIVIGVAVAWGRAGRDLGSILLIVAAAALVVAQSRIVGRWSGSGIRLARLGVATSAFGLGVLLLGLAAAIVLEPPLVIRLGASPSDYWTAAMLLTLAGAALHGVATLRSSSKSTLAGAMVVAAAWPLALSLLVPYGDRHTSEGYFMASDGSKAVAWATATLPRQGWFTNDPLVGAAGAVFGLAWMAVGFQRLASAHGPALARRAVSGRRRPGECLQPSNE